MFQWMENEFDMHRHAYVQLRILDMKKKWYGCIHIRTLNICFHFRQLFLWACVMHTWAYMNELHVPKEGLLEPIHPLEAIVAKPLSFPQGLKFSSSMGEEKRTRKNEYIHRERSIKNLVKKYKEIKGDNLWW